MTQPSPIPPRQGGKCALCGDSRHHVRFEKLSRRFLECRSCRLVWIEPMPSPQSLQTYYQSAYSDGAGRYVPFMKAQEIRRLIAEHRMHRIRKRIDVNSDAGRWLDVGCTTGDFIAASLEIGARGEGIDISGDAVAKAVERGLVAHHSRAEDFEPASPYRVVTAFDLIEHLLDPRAFVRRIRKWLRRDGWFVLTTPNVRSILPQWLMRRHWFYYWPDEHLFYFDPDTITRLLEEEGLSVIEVCRAYKPLTLDYAARNLEAFNRRLGPAARGVTSILPKRVRSRPVPMYTGEMMVIARPARGDSR